MLASLSRTPARRSGRGGWTGSTRPGCAGMYFVPGLIEDVDRRQVSGIVAQRDLFLLAAAPTQPVAKPPHLCAARHDFHEQSAPVGGLVSLASRFRVRAHRRLVTGAPLSIMGAPMGTHLSGFTRNTQTDNGTKSPHFRGLSMGYRYRAEQVGRLVIFRCRNWRISGSAGPHW